MSAKIEEQLARLEQARAERDGTGEPAKAVEKKPEQPRNEDGTFAKSDDETPPAKADDDTGAGDTGDGDDDERGDEPTGVEVEVDGETLVVDPLLAAVIQKDNERQAKGKETPPATVVPPIDEERLAERVAAKLKPAAPSAAEVAAVQAEADANEQARIDALKPSKDLLVSDPDKWQEQQDKYLEARDAFTAKKIKRDVEADLKKPTPEQLAAQQREAQARADREGREILTAQFKRAFPQLADDAMKDIVEKELNKHFDDVVASGIVTPGHPNYKFDTMTPQQREDFKYEQFEIAAGRIAKAVVKLKQAGQKVAKPAERAADRKPPNLATGQNKPREKAPKQEAAKPKEKYPPGSVSAELAARRARLSGAPAAR